MKKKSILVFIIIVIGLILLFNSFNDKEVKENNEPFNKVEENNDKKENKAKLTLVGDFLFEQPFYDAKDAGDDINNYFKNVKQYFKDDDLSIGNMEVVIGNDDLKVSGTGFNFCAPSYIGDLVNTLDLQVLSTTNNHTFDRGIEGIKSTLNYFKNNTNIMTVGTYESVEDREKDRILDINGIKFGFLAYSYGTNITIPKEYRNLVGLFKNPDSKTITDNEKDTIKKEVSNLRSEVDVLIVIMHWGIEFTYSPNQEQKDMAKMLNELGVDIIMGSHSHSIEPIERIGDEHKTLVYYSMGNFVSADDDISRTGEEFDNAYQVGLLSTLNVTKEENNITIDNIKTEPIINYYDNNLRNFELIPLSSYTEEKETSHYRYKYNFNRNFIEKMYKDVIPEDFR